MSRGVDDIVRDINALGWSIGGMVQRPDGMWKSCLRRDVSDEDDLLEFPGYSPPLSLLESLEYCLMMARKYESAPASQEESAVALLA